MTTPEQLRMSDIAIQQVAPVVQSTLFWLLVGASEFDAEVISQKGPEKSCCSPGKHLRFARRHAARVLPTGTGSRAEVI